MFPYRLNEETGLVDYDGLEKTSALYRPKLIVSGASAYPRLWDYERLREIADRCGAYLLYDMAHVSGLIAGGVIPSPFSKCDLITTTTHKSLRGPRGAMIFYRKGVRSTDKKGNKIMYDLESRVNAAVFPGHQGGPHNHTITALAVALKQAQASQFKDYQEQVLKNCSRMAEAFLSKGYELVSGGTDNHLMLINLKNQGVDGARVEKVLELVNIACNKNTVPGDKSAMIPGGIRVGTPAITTRGMVEEDMDRIVEFVDQGVQIAKRIQSQLGEAKKMKDFKEYLDKNKVAEVEELRESVTAFARSFPVVGFDASEMKYKD